MNLHPSKLIVHGYQQIIHVQKEINTYYSLQRTLVLKSKTGQFIGCLLFCKKRFSGEKVIVINDVKICVTYEVTNITTEQRY